MFHTGALHKGLGCHWMFPLARSHCHNHPSRGFDICCSRSSLQLTTATKLCTFTYSCTSYRRFSRTPDFTATPYLPGLPCRWCNLVYEELYLLLYSLRAISHIRVSIINGLIENPDFFFTLAAILNCTFSLKTRLSHFQSTVHSFGRRLLQQPYKP